MLQGRDAPSSAGFCPCAGIAESGAQSSQRIVQFARFETRNRGGWCGGRALRQGNVLRGIRSKILHESEALHRVSADGDVDPLNNLAGYVLQFHGDRPGTADEQRAALQAAGGRFDREARANHQRPVGHDRRRRRRASLERGAGQAGHQGADRAWAIDMPRAVGRALAVLPRGRHRFPVPSAPSAAALLHWYDRHRRTMPWRAMPGEAPDPYRVWLSEIMLQQTTVVTVIPYFERFMQRFPTVHALAAAEEGSVMEAWAGLGYYARARNLHRCAQIVAARGSFPDTLEGLHALPGVGAYTAAAVASIAFGRPVVPVDGNVERVVARVFAIMAPLPGARADVARAAARLGGDAAAMARPADFTQALFDLGATICTPRTPACVLCPWQADCAGRACAAELPRKAPRKLRPKRYGAQFWLSDGDRVLLRRRPAHGLLGGMLELPGAPWRPEPWPVQEALLHAPQEADWQMVGPATHAFTHFELITVVFAARVAQITAIGLPRDCGALAGEALPTVMRRCIALVAAARLF